MRRVLGPADALLQQGAWWWSVLCAARGAASAAAIGGMVVVAAHLVARRGERARIARVAIVAALYGLTTDTLLAAAGLVSFAGGGPRSPAWMVGLWAAFGVGLTASLRATLAWRSLALASVAALAGPLAYRAGAALGALSFAGGHESLLAVAAQWCLGVPLLARVARGGAAAARGAGGPPSTRLASERQWAR